MTNNSQLVTIDTISKDAPENHNCVSENVVNLFNTTCHPNRHVEKKSKANHTNIRGEFVLDNCPTVKNCDNESVYPQHYLKYKHTLASLESIVLDLSYDDKFQIFVYQKQGALFLQVGILGVDNYDSQSLKPNKIVYGRNWKIEPQLPTSELIQTAFLALQKAKEHENRELFRVAESSSTLASNAQYRSCSTTPFNNHQDLPLFASNADVLLETSTDMSHSPMTPISVARYLERVKYGNLSFKLTKFEQLTSTLTVIVLTSQGDDLENLPELPDNTEVVITLEHNNLNHFQHALMNTLINKSNRHVDEHFKYKGYPRFSWQNNVEKISKFALQTRGLHKQSQYKDFETNWHQMMYETDETRVPPILEGQLADKIEQELLKYQPLAGSVPEIFSQIERAE